MSLPSTYPKLHFSNFMAVIRGGVPGSRYETTTFGCARTLHIEVYRACMSKQSSGDRAPRMKLAADRHQGARGTRPDRFMSAYMAVYRRRKTHRRQNTAVTLRPRGTLVDVSGWQYVNLTAPRVEYCHFTALPTLDARYNLIFSTNPMTSVSHRPFGAISSLNYVIDLLTFHTSHICKLK